MRRIKEQYSETRATDVLEVVLPGPISPDAVDGQQYANRQF